MKPNNKRISKFLSLVLRHKPDTIGLELDENGWADTQELLEKLGRHDCKISFETLQDVVATNDKKRFAFNADQSKIRASQGHSLNVDLGYAPSKPPTFLYHGTATRFLDSIKEGGVIRGSRQQVHLSKDLETASNVGSRHGKVIILTVESEKMHDAGFEFFVSENGVWLTDHVPLEYLKFPT